MRLQLYDSVGFDEMDESPTGEFVRLEDVIELLESKLCPCVESDTFPTADDREELMRHMNCAWDAMMIEYHVALIKGEQK